MQVLVGHFELVNTAVWSPDGERVATASEDVSAKIWSASSGECVQTLTGHTDTVNSALWSPDGLHLSPDGFREPGEGLAPSLAQILADLKAKV